MCSAVHLLQAFDRVSGSTVALKLYHMNKLNSISSHQVAREVRPLCAWHRESKSMPVLLKLCSLRVHCTATAALRMYCTCSSCHLRCMLLYGTTVLRLPCNIFQNLPLLDLLAVAPQRSG
jgi:hypothetical protein